jgi:hypothetical protein
MLDKLIEKIEELKSPEYIEEWDNGYNKAVDETLDILKEENKKKFNPEELGFHRELEEEEDFKVYIFKDNQIVYYINSDNYYIQGKTYKINNHIFGVTLLKSLGIVK